MHLLQRPAIVPLLIVLLVFLGACSADRQDPADNGLTAHPDTWLDQDSPDFHGKLVERDDPTFCTACHGTDLMGDGRSPSCWACHDGPGGHPEQWVVPGSATFHGDTVAVETNAECAQCHGADYKGGWAGISCFLCHDGPSGHPLNWIVPGSSTFHGNTVIAETNAECAQCHGADFQGGWAGTSCFLCHDGPGGHPYNWIVPGSSSFHGNEVKANGDAHCQECHGADLSGSWTEVACTDCHAYP